jgi:hypothetical protein
MRSLLGVAFTCLLGLAAAGLSAPPGGNEGTIYGFNNLDIDGNMVDLAKYKGKVVYIVNVATY